MTLAERIIQLRKEKFKSKLELCNRLGISHSQLSNMESGRVTRPSYHMMARMSDVFDVPLESWREYIPVWESE